MSLDLDLDVNLNLNATLDVVVDKQTPVGPADNLGVLSFQLLRAAQSQPRNIAEGAGRRTAVDQARFYTHARGSAMEAAAALDTMRVMKLIAEPQYQIGIELLEGIVAMLTKMT